MRTGECAVGCGACCKFVLLEVPLDYSRPDMAKWLALHGITLESLDEALVARIQIPCSALTGEGKCGVYGTDERPEMCSQFPYNQLSMRGLEDVCTYSFAERVPLVERIELEVL